MSIAWSSASVLSGRHEGGDFDLDLGALKHKTRNDGRDCLALIAPRAHHCVSTFARCKSGRGRRYRPALIEPPVLAACLAPPADGPNTFQIEGRAMDGGLACIDADDRDRRTRNNA